ncbi:MAG: LuxR C-terminal-related transcriptional regulator [Treponema sp.]|jgi:LuxR family maltose regulon positive regulatory protein|nr:LuxR C-terminal-related transcriptional regulator [Treponema sp.]
MFYSNVPINQSNRVYLERPRLDQILEQAVRRPVVFVNAGVGYGKTHAVYSFLRKCQFMTFWIQFSERDNIGVRFWENFTGAVGVFSPNTAKMLTEIGFPETNRKFAYYLSIPQMDLLSDRKYIFVYDNFQLIRDRKVLRFLEHSITTSFPNITSILISRNEPLAGAEKISAGDIARITEEDLRFTPEETAAFFELHQLKVPAEIVSAVYRDTEGWAFATYLAALSLNRDSTHYVGMGVRSNIFRLIEGEILADVGEDARKFLIKMSLIDHLAPELLEDIQGEENLLDQLDNAIGAFFQFDDYLNAYRIHPLFLEFLEGRQNELGEGEIRETYLKAAEWCLKNNQKIDAFTYLEKAGNYGRFLTAVNETLPLIVAEPVAQILLSVCEKAPAEAFAQDSGLYVLYTWVLISLGLLERADRELREIIAKLKARNPMPANDRALLGCYINLGLCGYFASMYTQDYSFVEYFELAARCRDTSGRTIKPPESVVQVAFCVCRVSGREKGGFEKCIAALDKMVPCLAMAYNGCGWGLNDLARSEFALFQGKFEDAWQHALVSLRKARERSQYEIEGRALFYLLRIGLVRGDGETVARIFKQIEERAGEIGFVNQNILRDIMSGWFFVQTRQRDRVASWLKNDFEESDLNSVLYGLETLVKARYHLAEKRFSAVLATLENRNDKYGAAGYILGRVEIKAIEAVCRYQMKNIAGAVEALRAAYELSLPNGIVLPFFELGRTMRALLSAVSAKADTGIDRQWIEKTRKGVSAYAKKLMIVIRQYQGRNFEGRGDEDGNAALLSPRELEVLTGLSRGLTRKEIAENAALSENTVKSIIRSIYTKLDAVNQADAVRIATVRGIFK